jgi:TolA-binding protein
MTKIVLLVSLFIVSTACIKTADQVNREKKLDLVSEQIGDTQGLLADLVTQMKSMQGQLDRLSGKIEEIEHKQRQVNPENLTKMSETLEVMKGQREADAQQMTQIQNELKDQRAFLEKVTDSLTNVKEKEVAPSSKTEKKKTARSQLDNALNLIKKNIYKDARDILESLIDDPALTPGDKNKVLHGLGKVEYYTGNHDKAMVYFSKIFTKFPKASLAPSSLLFIGKSLEKMGKKDEATQAFKKILDDYKGTKEADEAKREL